MALAKTSYWLEPETTIQTLKIHKNLLKHVIQPELVPLHSVNPTL